MMSKKISLFWIPIAVVLAAVMAFNIAYLAVSGKYSDAVNSSVGIGSNDDLSAVEQLIKNNYDGKIDENSMKSSMIRGYVSGLDDKYSAYMTAEEYSSFMQSENGNAVGIGITVTYNESKDAMEVLNVTADSPADVSGLLPGDMIISVDGNKISELGYLEAVGMVGGKEGTQVTLSVLRDEDTFTVVCTRAKIETDSVMYHIYRGSTDIGIIRISEFNFKTAEQFSEAIKSLKGSGCDKFVFDLRDNPGGSLTSVVSVLDSLLPEGPIVHIYYANGEEMHENSDSDFLDAECAVLVNQKTASAAELFTAALKDYTMKGDFNATVVGTKTFGKGVLQSVFTLPSGAALKLTTAHYNPPYSENYDGVGVLPNVEAELSPEAQQLGLYKLDDYNDNQLIAAVGKIE